MLNLSVITFATHYIPQGTMVAVVKNSERVFEGTLNELFYSPDEVRNFIVAMVSASPDGYLCLSCRN